MPGCHGTQVVSTKLAALEHLLTWSSKTVRARSWPDLITGVIPTSRVLNLRNLSFRLGGSRAESKDLKGGTSTSAREPRPAQTSPAHQEVGQAIVSSLSARSSWTLTPPQVRSRWLARMRCSFEWRAPLFWQQRQESLQCSWQCGCGLCFIPKSLCPESLSVSWRWPDPVSSGAVTVGALQTPECTATLFAGLLNAICSIACWDLWFLCITGTSLPSPAKDWWADTAQV